MTTKAKDGRETLQERLRKMVMPVSDQAYPVCIEAADAIDAAQAEIARLEEAERVLEHNGFRRCDIAACNCNSWHFVGGFKARFDEIKQVVEDAGYSTNGRTLLDAVKHMAKDATPFPVAKDVVERITDPIERTIADALLGANVPFTSEKGGTHRLDFGLGDGVFVEVKQFYTPRADSALQKNENVILIQGRRAAEKFASLLRQPEAAPERLIRNAALQEAAAHLRDMGYWTQGAVVLSLCTDASAPTPASAVASEAGEAPKSHVDHQQRRGAFADMIEEALESYHAFYMDDDFDYKNALDKICERLKERYEGIKPTIASTPAPASAQDESVKELEEAKARIELLTGVIYRNVDPMDASHEDAAVAIEISEEFNSALGGSSDGR